MGRGRCREWVSPLSTHTYYTLVYQVKSPYICSIHLPFKLTLGIKLLNSNVLKNTLEDIAFLICVAKFRFRVWLSFTKNNIS